jgi:hypothetical protein
MNTTLREQFETFADCCLELARRADTPAHRSRLMKMAHEYRQATALVSMERQDFGGPSINRANSFDMLRGPHRHVANEVIRDLITSILVGFAVVTIGLLLGARIFEKS